MPEKNETPRLEGEGLENSGGRRVLPNSTALLASCVEIDLRISRDDQHRYLRHALDGITPGDVVKILVDRSSDVTAVYGANLRGVKVQLTASDVYTRRTWDAVLREVIA